MVSSALFAMVRPTMRKALNSKPVKLVKLVKFMKNFYLIPQSRIELAQTLDIMDDFIGIAAASNGGSIYAPEAAQGD